jgi:TetR/AcrR family transcriptional regulator, repressor of fatR-cypB operon
MNIHSFVAATEPTQTGSTAPSGKHDQIMAAALELFAERGFHGTAVPLIAEKAGVGAGTVYRYFESKEAIVNALYQHHKKALGALVLAQVSPDQPPRVQFHNYWKTMAKFARENPAAHQFLELHHHSPYLDETSRAVEERLLGMAYASFVNFRAQQVVKDVEPAILMAVVHGAFTGMFKACYQQQLMLTDEAISIAEQCVWEAIRR